MLKEALKPINWAELQQMEYFMCYLFDAYAGTEKEDLPNELSLEELKDAYIVERFGSRYLKWLDTIVLDIWLNEYLAPIWKEYHPMDGMVSYDCMAFCEEKEATRAEQKQAYDIFIKAIKGVSK